MPKHSVDLIYLDPPFNSQQNYNLLYRTMTGKPVPEQAEAFLRYVGNGCSEGSYCSFNACVNARTRD